MAHSKQLRAEHRAKVAEQIGRLAARHGLGGGTNARHELVESFEIYVLRHEDIRAATETTRLAKLLHWSGQWHCQITVDGKPAGFAQCAESDRYKGEWAIHSLFQSDLAEKIAKAVHHIDKERSERETEVKLFFVPAFHLYAFFLEHPRESHVLVIDSPFPVLRAGKEFQTEAGFLKRLQEIRPIRGLVPGRGQTIRITSTKSSLAEMESTTFHVHDEQGNSVSAIWSIAPGATGMLVPSDIAAPSATYTAPPGIGAQQAITVTAIAGGALARTNVLLTPIGVRIVPTSVRLKCNQQQRFLATVAGDPSNAVTWVLSPGVGTITPDGVYTPDPKIVDSCTLNVIAVSALGQKVASSTVSLIPPPWTSWKRNLLGAYLLAVFLLVFLLIGLWPPTGPDPQLTIVRQAVQVKVDTDNDNIKKAEGASGNLSTSGGAATPNASLAALNQNKQADEKTLEDVTEKERASVDPLDHLGMSAIANRPGATIPREIDLILLALLGGALGAFLHSARSFTAFVGNEELRGTWAWWYYLHPFLGAILALAFYLAVRGGFLAMTTGSTLNAAGFSPFALTSISLLVGMFSKNAIAKLSDVFETLFQPSSPRNFKNPLSPAPQIQSGVGLNPVTRPAGSFVSSTAGEKAAPNTTVTLGQSSGGFTQSFSGEGAE